MLIPSMFLVSVAGILSFAVLLVSAGSSRPVVKLTTSQVCSACLTTVESMFLVAAETRSMDDKVPDTSLLLKAVCDNPMMDFYADFIRHGCNYLRTSDEARFERIYQRISAEEYSWIAYKSVYYEQAKQICEHEMKACHVGRLLSIDKKDRTTCTACQIVVSEMDAFRTVVRSTNYTHMSGSVCATLGFKYSPYNWLEDICSEIIDDYGVTIAKLMRIPVSDEAPLPDSKIPSDLSPVEVCQRLDKMCPLPSEREGRIVPEDEL